MLLLQLIRLSVGTISARVSFLKLNAPVSKPGALPNQANAQTQSGYVRPASSPAQFVRSTKLVLLQKYVRASRVRALLPRERSTACRLQDPQTFSEPPQAPKLAFK